MADLDRDGDLDLVLSGSRGLTFLLNNGNGTFSESSITLAANGEFLPYILELTDLNGDGNLDAVYGRRQVGATTGSFLSISYGNGDGTFTAISTFQL